ncbi:Lipoprotein-anchoring transpeptidase ErfK/SrfK [Sphingomonas gellani]|uniref:Lipoprotein-anchoring transpeptidase ErfK/SrfK n=1 Tax=Sphingomonas gellani TaxID=1166340 RepID=A0A1H7YIT7_9SPHN|nr:L,D-transpeptidase family protein [Sphingomonas gellani]SEM45851.1 Lipoprotein-anchoring transpeptidase ErfK/SrfK [Sphingomonas gellani]
MSATPAQWAARLILVAALGAGLAFAVSRLDMTSPASDPQPEPAAPAKGPAPASAPKPDGRYGASFPIPGEEGPEPPAAPAPTVAPQTAASAPAASPPAADDQYRIKRVLDTGGPIKYGAWFWDDKDVPAGQTIITVDTRANVLSIFRNGYEIGTAAIIYGADEMPTPLGVYPIIGKDAHHVSNLYNAPMPYMLRLTNDGISIHGSKVAFDAATHGCIGVPTPFARKLFEAVKLGDKVIVTHGETLAKDRPVTAL